MNQLWHIHIPKTGGTSIHSYCMNREFKNSQYSYFGHERISNKRERELSQKGDLKKFLVIRDPVAHSKSLYSYICTDTAHFQHKETIAMTFSEWIRSYDRFKGGFYIEFLDQENRSLDKAISLLKNVYILRTESLTEDFNNFLRDNGEDQEFTLHINRSKEIGISLDDEEFIKEIRSQDYELFKILGLNESLSSNIDKK